MTTKDALNGIKQRINYALHKPENVDTPERQQKRIDKSAKQIEVIEQALNELERLKKFKETFDNYELAKKQGFIAYENWQECEIEHAELKYDVKRYFELANNYEITEEVLDEFSKLRDKLLEVGNEDE